MYRSCGWSWVQIFKCGQWPTKKYLQLTVVKMRAIVVFTKKYSRLYGCSDTRFTGVVNCVNPKLNKQ